MLCDTYIACLVTFTEVKGRRLNFCLGIIYITLSKGLKFVKLHVCKNVNRQQAEVAQGVPGRLRPRIFLRFRTTRVVGCQPYATAAFTPGEIPGNHFQGMSRPQSTWFRRGEPRKKIPSDTTGNRSRDRPAIAQCLNHHATPGPK